MPLEKMGALEARIRTLVARVQELKARTGQLEEELRSAKGRLAKQAELSQQWEQDRSDIRFRVEKVLGDLEIFECLDDPRVSKEVALD